MTPDTIFDSYETATTIFDEMYRGGEIRKHYEAVFDFLKNTTVSKLDQYEVLAKKLFLSQGITFTVYSDNEGIERIFPFDIIPRIITATEWKHIEAGIKQRLTALNMFIKDIYFQQQIIKDGVVPIDMIQSCPNFLPQMVGFQVPYDLYVHIAGIDLIRDSDGTFYVLEDNLRTPSGVSYMLENREIIKRVLPNVISRNYVRPVSDYPQILFKILQSLAPKQQLDPYVVLLTPGIFNSAYYEHTFLARQMGIELVEGRDLIVKNHIVYAKTTHGLRRVDVIYRRIDDDFLDPTVFNPQSMLGVPNIMAAYRLGNVAIVNAVGNGVADDKAIYPYVPDMIKYYLNETPILKNVPTYQMSNPDERNMVLKNLSNMVVKEANGSGGYGMLIGNTATEKQLDEFTKAINENPRNYIAQPIIQLSTAPCYVDGKLTPRRIDLRPYALCGPNGIELVPGGLTRVALRKGSLVVNSSQGGGSKDTWVLSE